MKFCRLHRFFMCLPGLLLLSVVSATSFAQSAYQKALDQEKAVLKYGINSQILDLISTLKQQQDNSLNKELIGVFNSTYDDQLRSAIIGLFTSLQYQGAEAAVRTYVESKPDNSDLVSSCISYLGEVIKHPEKQTLDAIAAYIENQNNVLAGTAIRSVGSIASRNGPAAYDFSGIEKKLLDLLKANGTSQDVQQDIVLTLGDLQAKQAGTELISILTDTGQSTVLREYAANSLGKIGDLSAVKPLSSLLKSTNSQLRAYAVDALSYFSTPEVDPMLMQALRDSYALVRSSALKGIRRNHLDKAVPAVIFKAEHDPNPQVQIAAIETLGALGTKQSWDALRSIFENANISLDQRGSALAQLLKGDIAASLKTIEKVAKDNWGITGERTLEMTAKAISTTKAPELKTLDERFLTHPNPIIQVYGLRGIALNNFVDLKAQVEKLNSPTAPAYLKRQAQLTIEELAGGSGASTPAKATSGATAAEQGNSASKSGK